jgi:hypothetical protein
MDLLLHIPIKYYTQIMKRCSTKKALNATVINENGLDNTTNADGNNNPKNYN